MLPGPGVGGGGVPRGELWWGRVGLLQRVCGSGRKVGTGRDGQVGWMKV